MSKDPGIPKIRAHLYFECVPIQACCTFGPTRCGPSLNSRVLHYYLRVLSEDLDGKGPERAALPEFGTA
jgi:hypothetical protein